MPPPAAGATAPPRNRNAAPRAGHRVPSPCAKIPAPHLRTRYSEAQRRHCPFQRQQVRGEFVSRAGGQTGDFVNRACADYWRQRVEQARTLAQAMTVPAAKRDMHFFAQVYERRAEQGEITARSEADGRYDDQNSTAIAMQLRCLNGTEHADRSNSRKSYGHVRNVHVVFPVLATVRACLC